MVNEATASEFSGMLEARGVTRRSFMKLCGTIAVAAGLSELAAPRVASALENSVIGATKGNLYPVIWIEGASCTGCTESFPIPAASSTASWNSLLPCSGCCNALSSPDIRQPDSYQQTELSASGPSAWRCSFNHQGGVRERTRTSLPTLQHK